MRDLRKKILLESGKTVSRKARSRPQSGAPSAVTSPSHSRAPSQANSRYASEDEGDWSDSDIGGSYGGSSYALSDDENGDGAVPVPWTEVLRTRIAEMEDRKRSSVQGRTDCLHVYRHIIQHHYAAHELQDNLSQVLHALFNSISNGTAPEEAVAAIRAVSMTLVSVESEDIYDQYFRRLKSICESSDQESVKASAMDAMALVTVFGGGVGSEDELLDFLRQTVESDGESVGAFDNAHVVKHALSAWGFVASHMEDDLQVQAEEAMAAFSEQLDSDDYEVQIAAGNNIALILEKARDCEPEDGSGTWDIHDNKHKLIERVSELSSTSERQVKRRERKDLHTAFRSIQTAIELGVGPEYSTARREDDTEYGYRSQVRVNNVRIVIDSWSLQARIEMARKIFEGGLGTHYSKGNPVLRDDLLAGGNMEEVARAPDVGTRSHPKSGLRKSDRGY